MILLQFLSLKKLKVFKTMGGFQDLQSSINFKKEDAITSASGLRGGWDCIIWDPPYLNEDYVCLKNPKSRWNAAKKITFRLYIDPNYLSNLRILINQKRNDDCFWVSFSNNRHLTADFIINWYKGREYGGLGGFIRRDTEYIYITKG